jgi:hypothetical protein
VRWQPERIETWRTTGPRCRAHTRGLSALRQTQVEHHAEHKADLAEFKAGVRAGFAPVETRFAEVNAGLRVIVGLLEGAAGRPPEAPIRRRLRRRHRRVSVVGSDRVPQKDLRQPQVGPATMAC